MGVAKYVPIKIGKGTDASGILYADMCSIDGNRVLHVSGGYAGRRDYRSCSQHWVLPDSGWKCAAGSYCLAHDYHSVKC